MTDNTEPTIDEQIRLKLLSLINNLQDVWLEDKDSWYGAETTVPEILALIANQVTKARLYETSLWYNEWGNGKEQIGDGSWEDYYAHRIQTLNGVKNK